MAEGNPSGKEIPPVHPLRAPSTSAAALKQFAHPLRMQMYEYLGDHGPATSAELARVTGESTGQTSYHLRQLAKHGFISEVPDRGTARERWWKAEGFSFDLGIFEDDTADAETRTTVDIVQRQLVEQRVRRLLEWIDRQATEEKAWIEASISNDVTVRMTAPELGELQAALEALIHEHVTRARARRDEGSDEGVRVVKVYSLGFPLADEG